MKINNENYILNNKYLFLSIRLKSPKKSYLRKKSMGNSTKRLDTGPDFPVS